MTPCIIPVEPHTDSEVRRRGLCVRHYFQWILDRPAEMYGVVIPPAYDMTRRKPRSDWATFWARVAQGPSGCLLWTGKTIAGYGKFCFNNRQQMAHRWLYEHTVGPIPEGLVLDHLCRNPPCVNPAHLEAVTQRENVRRSMSPTAILWRAGTCGRGHPIDLDSYVDRDGYRHCRICRREKRKEGLYK